MVAADAGIGVALYSSLQGHAVYAGKVCSHERIDDLYAEFVELCDILKDPGFHPCGPAVCASAPGKVTFSALGAHLGEHSIVYLALLSRVKSINLEVRSMENELEQDYQRGEGPEELRSVIKEIAAVALTSVEGIRLLSVSRTSSNGPSQRLPSVLPLDVVKKPSHEFIDIVADHAVRFRSMYGSEAVDSILAEHRELRRAVEHGNEPELQRRLTDAAKEMREFFGAVEASWLSVLKAEAVAWRYSDCVSRVFHR
jgi:hypothetical protein